MCGHRVDRLIGLLATSQLASSQRAHDHRWGLALLAPWQSALLSCTILNMPMDIEPIE